MISKNKHEDGTLLTLIWYSFSSKPVDSHHRHDEARQKRRELEREMAVIEETLKRKRERSKERTSHKKHRKPSKGGGENSSDKKAGLATDVVILFCF